jgi:hypothetical protein
MRKEPCCGNPDSPALLEDPSWGMYMYLFRLSESWKGRKHVHWSFGPSVHEVLGLNDLIEMVHRSAFSLVSW